MTREDSSSDRPDWQLQSTKDIRFTAILVISCSTLSLLLMTTMIYRLGRMLAKRTSILSSPLIARTPPDSNNGTNSIDVLFMLSMAYVLSAASILFMSVSAFVMNPRTFHNDVCGWYVRRRREYIIHAHLSDEEEEEEVHS